MVIHLFIRNEYMDDTWLIEQVESFAKGYYEQVSARPNIWRTHVRLVRRYALELAEIEEVNSQIRGNFWILACARMTR